MPRIQDWEDKIQGQVIDKNFEKKFGLKVEDKSAKTPNLYSSIINLPKQYFNAVKNIGSVSIIPGFINGNI